MNNSIQPTIGEMVAGDYRKAAIFKKYHIDFCCKGNRTIDEVCEAKTIDRETLLNDLNSLEEQREIHPDVFKAMEPAKLADYIEENHHKYVEEAITQLKPYLRKVVTVHGGHHPELAEIEQEFLASAGELAMHMKKEELILFPYIRKMDEAISTNEKIVKPHFGKVENPVAMMKHEHDTEGERFRRISELSNDYNPPADACNTYRVTYALLKEFEEDLHLHIHLENNILFPRAIEMDSRLNLN